MRFVGRLSAEPWTFAVFAALSPLIDTSQMWVAFAQILPQVMRIRWSLSLIFLDFKCVNDVDLKRLVSMRCSSCCQQRFLAMAAAPA